ncbi:MAG: DUF234 domain-containing protein [Treponema sp.]|nr:DUF234 domain-containing protein [Treponema sp.]
MEMELVEKENFFNDDKKSGQKSIYKIKNNLVNFIFSFIEENRSARELLSPQDFYSLIIEPRIDEYVSLIFEDVCRQFLSRLNKTEIPEKILKIGRYWINDRITKTQTEIDICAKTTGGYNVYDCKWQKARFDMSIMNDLEEKAKKISGFKVTGFGGFSRSGFTAEVQRKYSRLYTLIDMFK